MKRILMIAYHFPPIAGSSGVQRTLRLAQHLPKLGWQPLVLTTSLIAYPSIDTELTRDIPPDIIVKRSLALDTARHLSFKNRYFGWMARPDRWCSWRMTAVPVGMKLISRYRPQVIWSTFPIATAHRIASILHQRSGIPWIADFRDPMAQDGYPRDPSIWKSYKRIEEEALRNALLCTFTAPGAVESYRHKYPEASKRLAVIENGYDEESFAGISADSSKAKQIDRKVITLLHSGIVYPLERNPSALFVAIRRLLDSGSISQYTFKLRFRAPVHIAMIKELADQFGIQNIIEICPPLPYREALAEMVQADALLIMQASSCNNQIPAKLYEYLRAGRPILALTDPEGDTCKALCNAGINTVSGLDSAEQIEILLPSFLASVRRGRAALPKSSAVAHASRMNRSRIFVETMENALSKHKLVDLT